MGRHLNIARAAPVLLAALLGTTAADADVIVSGQMDTLAEARDGGGLTVDWSADGRVLQAGLAGYGLGEARWGFVRGTVARRVRPGLWTTAELRVGRGFESGDGWNYLNARGGVLRSFGPRFDAEAELQYADIAHLAGPLGRVAATYRIGTVWSLQLARHQSLGGDLETRLWGYRGERSFGRVRVLAGGATGHTAPQLLIPRTGAVPDQMREGYAGVSFPRGDQQVTATLGRVTVSGIKRWTATVSYKR